MLFSSMIFLWAFLPIVIIVNYIFNLIVKDSKDRIAVKNIFLLIASLCSVVWLLRVFMQHEKLEKQQYFKEMPRYRGKDR